MFPDVPLLIPEVNENHLDIVKHQKFGKGFIVTNPNCSTIGLVIALKPLQDAFGLKKVFVTTMQAISEALGMALPTSALVPFNSDYIKKISFDSGRQILKLLEEKSL